MTHRHGSMSSGRKPKNRKKTLLRLLTWLSPYKPQLFLITSMVVIYTLLGLVGPYLSGVAIDLVKTGGDIDRLARIAVFLVAVYMLYSFISWYQGWLMIGISQTVVKDLRDALFSKYQELSLQYFDTSLHGDLISRITNDIENISTSLTSSFTETINSLILIIGTVIVMLVIHPVLAVASMITIPVMLFLTRYISSRSRKYYIAQQRALGALNGIIEETVSGEQVVQAYCHEDRSLEEFHATNTDMREVAVKAQILGGIMGPIMTLVNNFGYVVVAAVGGYLVINAMATVGVVAMFLQYYRKFTHPIVMIASLYNSIQSALAGAERVFEVLDEEPQVVNKEDAVVLDTITGDVEFNNVCFGYDPVTPVLCDINIAAQAGQTIALVGPTGAGKTTVVNLLTRFYDVQTGAIKVDEVDLRDLEKASLRTKLGIVLQDTTLFSDTVRENIRYGRLDATDEEVEEAARLAHAEEFILRLPDGFDTKLVGSASGLSQGQRQLLAIARAILANPRILILDEATSSVDTRTEMDIQNAMFNLMTGRTSFVIAHRLSTIRRADIILVINDGKIVERGNHDELLAKKGFYYDLYNSQFVREVS